MVTFIFSSHEQHYFKMYWDHESGNRRSMEDFHKDLKDLEIVSYQFEPELDQTNQEDSQ